MRIKNTLSYTEAYQELNSILERLKEENVNIDTIEKDLTRAQELTKFCSEKLRSIESTLQKMDS